MLSVIQKASKQPSLFHPVGEYDGDPRGHAGTEAASWCGALSVLECQECSRWRRRGRGREGGGVGERKERRERRGRKHLSCSSGQR